MKFLAILLVIGFLYGCGGGSSNSNIDNTNGYNVEWVQTSNSVRVVKEIIGNYRSRTGFGAYNLYDYANKSFMFTSGGEFNNTYRTDSDADFITFSFNNNLIYIDKNPIGVKYIAGFVTNILEGDFGYGKNSLVMIDQGRESLSLPPSQSDNSYLWRMDKNPLTGLYDVTEFGKEWGRQFWHSSSSPIDIDLDGKLDFVVSNLGAKPNSPTLVLFTANGSTDLGNNLCPSNWKSSGSSALIKLANGNHAVISLPYTVNVPDIPDKGSIIELDHKAKAVRTTCYPVRNTDITQELSSSEGYNSIKVMDINSDGLMDFIAIAEYAKPTKNSNHLKRMLYFLQQPDSTFKISNVDLGLTFTYMLPNASLNEEFKDWVSNEFVIGNIEKDKKALFFNTHLITQSSIDTYGLRGGIAFSKLSASNYTIQPNQIYWNVEQKPFSYRYIFPTEINNDGIIDFLLIGECLGGENCYNVSALLSRPK